MKTVEFIWLQRLTYKLCPWIVFPSKKKKIEEILPSLVEKTMIMTTHVQVALADYLSTTYTFDLWMSKGAHDVFVVVVNFISSDWELNHVTIGLFEVMDTSGASMAPKLQKLLNKFSLTQKLWLTLRIGRLV
jgi:hypothetical protein